MNVSESIDLLCRNTHKYIGIQSYSADEGGTHTMANKANPIAM